MRRGAVYCRVSTLGQAKEGYSLEWQITNLPKLAQQAGAIVTEEDIYTEVKSGAKDDRPEYNRLMTLIMEGYYQEVWVVEKSRLSRTESRIEEQRIIDALQKFGCVIRTPGMTFDVSSFEGELFNDFDSSINRYERKRIRARMMNGKVTKISKGGYTGGNPPTGYVQAGRDPETGKITFEIDEPKAEMVKRAFYLASIGQSANAIAKQLKEEGHTGPSGGALTATTVLGWLKNHHYAGYRQQGYRTGTKSKTKMLVEENDYLPPLVSKTEFQQVQDMLNRRTVVWDKRMTSPLSGILTCGNCSTGMIASSQRGKRTYICPSKVRGNSCKGDSPKQIYQDIAHQMFIDFLPGFIKYVETKAPFKQARFTPGKKEIKDTLEKKKADLYKKIMSNIRQQEDSYSEIRKIRIIELEAQYKQIEQEITEAAKSNIVTLPTGQHFSALAHRVTIEDLELLKLTAQSSFNRIYFMKRGHYHSGAFEITRIITAWGDECRVTDNQFIYFEGKR